MGVVPCTSTPTTARCHLALPPSVRPQVAMQIAFRSHAHAHTSHIFLAAWCTHCRVNCVASKTFQHAARALPQGSAQLLVQHRSAAQRRVQPELGRSCHVGGRLRNVSGSSATLGVSRRCGHSRGVQQWWPFSRCAMFTPPLSLSSTHSRRYL
jgi:hypothetical protein